jgi:hypothetical protein
LKAVVRFWHIALTVTQRLRGIGVAGEFVEFFGSGVATLSAGERAVIAIQQATGMPKSRGNEAAAFLSEFVERMKASGFVTAALERHKISGAFVAPATG